MPKTTSTPAPAPAAREAGPPQGKTYGYQGSGATETATGAGIDASKQKVVSAFDDFLDALADRVGPGHDAAEPAVVATPAAPTPPVVTAAPSGGGIAAPPPKSAPSAGTPRPTGGGGGESTMTESASLEAFERTAAIQREAYRIDRIRETTRATRRETAPRTPVASVAPLAPAAPLASPHQPDSNRAPLTETRSFDPSFGAEGRPQGVTTRERMAVPLAKRPETVPAPGVVNLGKPIDAYFGSFGSALERAMARGAVNMRQYEVIIGTDDRVRVTNNAVYPWRCICSLLITAASGNHFVGTGWLVGPRLLLTAGHCVYMTDEGGWVRQIEVIPGRDADERPYGSATATDFRSVTGWTQDNNSDFDYGAILLPEGNRYGEQLGWFGYSNCTDDYLRGLTLNLSGYPGDGGKTGIDGTQWFASRTVDEVMERQISYQMDTYGGQSGSPVWEMRSDGSRYGVAIHTWGTATANGGTRITADVFDNVVRWAGEAP